MEEELPRAFKPVQVQQATAVGARVHLGVHLQILPGKGELLVLQRGPCLRWLHHPAGDLPIPLTAEGVNQMRS